MTWLRRQLVPTAELVLIQEPTTPAARIANAIVLAAIRGDLKRWRVSRRGPSFPMAATEGESTAPADTAEAGENEELRGAWEDFGGHYEEILRRYWHMAADGEGDGPQLQPPGNTRMFALVVEDRDHLIEATFTPEAVSFELVDTQEWDGPGAQELFH
ncbi:MAG: hypothetical protein ACYS5V_09950 [Planctomycetota bacterium]|jgi:hypothetical protein